MTSGEKAAAIVFLVCGFFIGGLGGLTLGADYTLKECELKGGKDEWHGTTR